MIIERWGLPPCYPASEVPDRAREFALMTLDAECAYAVRWATELGFKPQFKPLPNVKKDTQGADIANVWSFRLTVEGDVIPFMVVLSDPEPAHG